MVNKDKIRLNLVTQYFTSDHKDNIFFPETLNLNIRQVSINSIYGGIEK